MFPKSLGIWVTPPLIRQNQLLKLLGVYTSDTLSWSEHTDFVAKKVSNAIGGLERGRPYGPAKTLETIYKS